MKKYSLGAFLKVFFGLFFYSFRFLYQGIRGGAGYFYVKTYFCLFCDRIELFRTDLVRKNCLLKPLCDDENHEKIASKFTYSILIPVYHPDPNFFKQALNSALGQSVPPLEVLVGFDGPQDEKIYRILTELQKEHQGILYSFQIDREASGGGIAETTNFLAKKARGDFFLLLDHDDMISEDLLFYYQKSLIDEKDPSSLVLYCNEYKIDEKGRPVYGSEFDKPSEPPFPYIFVNFICHCLMIPKRLWDKVSGLRSHFNGSQDYDICLRLDLAGARFKNIPYYLYAWRVHQGSTASQLDQKPYANTSGKKALQEYIDQKGLSWEITNGLFPTLYGAAIVSNEKKKIHVIILPDRKAKKVLCAVDMLKEDAVYITVIDDGKMPLFVKEELKSKNVAIFPVPRQCSLGSLLNVVVESEKKADAVLILNPSINFEKGALQKMSLWLSQPNIGLVGCLLVYPDGSMLQGGIFLKRERNLFDIKTEMEELFARPGKSIWDFTLCIADALYGGCILIDRKTFVEVGGFDEDNPYPDINIAQKFKMHGKMAFYTPLVKGVYDLS